MKRKNLFLSLISSVVVAVAIVTVTICSFIIPKKNQETVNPGAENISINTGIEDKPTEEPKEDENENGDESGDETVDQAAIYDLENKFNRNGSAEYPYIIYSAENFNSLISSFGGKQRIVTTPLTEEVVDEEGKTQVVNKLDEFGHLIFVEVLDEEENKTYGVNHFELVNDIDFAGVEYTTLFNNDEAFIGVIDGKDFAIKNISINVNENNYEEKFSFVKDGNRYARVALFGEMNGAVIKNLKIDALKVSVSNTVYGYITSSKYELDNPYAELSVAGIAAYVTDSTLENVTVNAEVEGSSYYVNEKDADGNYIANNAMGGIAAVATNLSIEKSNVNVKVMPNAGGEYLVGGVAAYGYTAKVSDSEINVAVEASYIRNLSIAGMFAYGRVLDIQNTNVNFTLNEIADEATRKTYVESLTGEESVKAERFTTAAGLVAVLRANDDTQKTVMTNVKVVSNVDFDCIYAGAILDAYSTSDIANSENMKLITLTDVVVEVNANALAVHGFARQLVATTIAYTADATVEGYFNIKIAGDAKLSSYEVAINSEENVSRGAATILTAASKEFMQYSYANLYIEASESINADFMAGFEKWSINAQSFGSYKVV